MSEDPERVKRNVMLSFWKKNTLYYITIEIIVWLRISLRMLKHQVTQLLDAYGLGHLNHV